MCLFKHHAVLWSSGRRADSSSPSRGVLPNCLVRELIEPRRARIFESMESSICRTASERVSERVASLPIRFSARKSSSSRDDMRVEQAGWPWAVRACCTCSVRPRSEMEQPTHFWRFSCGSDVRCSARSLMTVICPGGPATPCACGAGRAAPYSDSGSASSASSATSADCSSTARRACCRRSHRSVNSRTSSVS